MLHKLAACFVYFMSVLSIDMYFDRYNYLLVR